MKFLSDESYNKLIKSSMDLANENTSLKEVNSKLEKENEELNFIINNPSKYEVLWEVKEGVILEKRIKNGGINAVQLGLIASLFIKDIIKGKSPDYNKLKEIKRVCSDVYWEYRVFNKELQSEKWILEANLNPKP